MKGRSPQRSPGQIEAIEDLMNQRDLPDGESRFLFSLLGTKMFLEHRS